MLLKSEARSLLTGHTKSPTLSQVIDRSTQPPGCTIRLRTCWVNPNCQIHPPDFKLNLESQEIRGNGYVSGGVWFSQSKMFVEKNEISKQVVQSSVLGLFWKWFLRLHEVVRDVLV